MVDFEVMHPREQIVMIMNRIYKGGMTTTSGGNLSIRDRDGSVWISPAGVDKGALRAADIVQVWPDGRVEGANRPSSEYPFHRAIYEVRPDVGAILHAHPAALVAFSIVRMTPDTRLLPQAEEICGKAGYAQYAAPGSKQLGANIAARFGQGFDCVLLENHGVVCAGETMLEAYQRFETLESCARLHIQGRRLGRVRLLSDEELELAHQDKNPLPEAGPGVMSAREEELRRVMCGLIQRACDGRLMTSTVGTLSARLNERDFLITPHGVDRGYIEPAEVVAVRDGGRESGKRPSRAVTLHKAIYERHPEIGAIIAAQPPATMAFGVTEAAINVRTIPESYVMLRDIPKVVFGARYSEEGQVAGMFSKECPVVILENEAVVAVGQSVIQAFDRLEVAEFTAMSLLYAMSLGGLVAMDEEQIAELRTVFRV